MSTTLFDQCIVDWYESQSEETLCDLRDRFDADTPRKAWIAFFADCPTPATKQPCESLAAPAAAVQGEGTSVAALFVRKVNHYASLGCDSYDIDRDALTWPGGSPGIFHPPCRAWGQLSHFANPRPGEKELSLWAMEKVRQCGGVLEHPYASRLWSAAGCIGFGIRDSFGGVLVPVFQSWWGHRAPKKSCLYIVGPLPEIPYLAYAPTSTTVDRMGLAERERTPQAFAAWLVNVAKACA